MLNSHIIQDIKNEIQYIIENAVNKNIWILCSKILKNIGIISIIQIEKEIFYYYSFFINKIEKNNIYFIC